MRQNSSAANALATKMYEERLKSPSQRDALDDAAMKQRFSENAGQASGQAFHGSAAAMASQIQSQNQQLGGIQAPEIKTELNPVLNPRAPGPEASLSGIPGIPGSNQASNNLTLKGWPLTGLDQLRSGFLQQQKSLMQASQPFHQLQMLSPQHQQQLMLAQQNLASASTGDVENRRLRMLLSNRNMGLGKDGFANSIGDIMASVGSPLQTGSPVLPRGDPDMLMKLRLAQMQQQNSLQQLQQNALSGQLPQLSNHNLHQPDKIAGASSLTMDGSMSNSFRGNDQAMKNQNGRKRKQPASSSGPANSSGTANTAGPSPNSPPSSPSTHTPGDVISMPSSLPHNGSSKPLMMFGADASSLTSPSNQLADIERFVEDGSLDDNVESFFSHDDIDPRDPVGRPMDLTKGFTFKEVNSVRASSSKVSCCHFSSDGKLLATGGQDKKVVLWYTDTLKLKSTLEEHTSLITDVRFSPSVSRLASSSYDKFVRVWDMDNPGYSLRNFTGHNASVMSLDFHPNKDDLISSCDEDGEIRYWSINNGSCTRAFKGGMTQMRFQPRHGRYLAAVAENLISIFDVETQACLHRLQGHTKVIHSLCWDPSGEFVASVSEDSVRVWALGSGNEGECVHELSCNGNKYYSCAFHPTYPSFLVIGCYQSLDLWNTSEKKTMTLSAHEGLITALAASTTTGLVASTGHDKIVKLWK